MAYNDDGSIIFIGDRHNGRQGILGIPCKAEANKPAVVLLQDVDDSAVYGDHYIWVDSEDRVHLGTSIPTDQNLASGLVIPQLARAKYSFAADGGAVGAITPVTTTTIPDNAVVFGGYVNSTTAVTSAGAATVSVGTAAGSSATSILGATGKADLSADAVIVSAAAGTPFKMTEAGAINITVGTAALTAGVIEIVVLYYVAIA